VHSHAKLSYNSVSPWLEQKSRLPQALEKNLSSLKTFFPLEALDNPSSNAIAFKDIKKKFDFKLAAY
jgi:exoribonuclease II